MARTKAVLRFAVRPVTLLLLAEIAIFGADAIVGGEPPVTAILMMLIALVNCVALAQWANARMVTVNGELRPPKPWTIPSLVVGQASAIAYFAIALWTEVHSPSHGGWDVPIALVAAAGLLIAVRIVAGALMSQPAAAIKSSRAVLLAILPLASSVQFWYSTFYRPAHQRPDVNIVAELKAVGPTHGGIARVLATITLENVGSTDVDFFDAIYSITGFHVPPVSAALTQAEADQEIKVPAVADTQHYGGVLRMGRLIPPGNHLAAGQKVDTSFVFAVDRNAFDKIRMTVMLSTLVDSGQPVSVTPTPADGNRCTGFDLPVAGRVRAALTDHPTAYTCIVYSADQPPGLTTRFGYADEGEPVSADSHKGISGGDPNTRGFATTVEFSLAGP